MNQIEKLDLLILDKMGYLPLEERRSRTAFPGDFDVLRAKEYHYHDEFTVWAMESCVRQSDFDRGGY